MNEDNFRKLAEDHTDSDDDGGNVLDVVGLGNAIMANVLGSEVASAQESLFNPVHQVFFRAGLLACREYMARFVESENASQQSYKVWDGHQDVLAFQNATI